MATLPAGGAAQVGQAASTAAAAAGATREGQVHHQAAADLAAERGTDAAVHAAAGQTVADRAVGAAGGAAWLQQTGEVLDLNQDLLTSNTSDLTSIHSSIMGLMGAPAASPFGAARGTGGAASSPAVQDNCLYSHALDLNSTGGARWGFQTLKNSRWHAQTAEAWPTQRQLRSAGAAAAL